MRNEAKINNLNDLKLEVARLKLLAKEQESYLSDQYDLLGQKIAFPVRVVNSLTSNIPGLSALQGLFTINRKNEGIGAKFFRIALPFVVNRFFFRKAGFIKKGLFTLLSKQVAGLLTAGKLPGIINSLASFIKPGKKDGRKKRPEDYGIPPESETY